MIRAWARETLGLLMAMAEVASRPMLTSPVRKLTRRLTEAKLRIPQACLEDLDYAYDAVDNPTERDRRGEVSLRVLAYDLTTGGLLVDVEVFRTNGSGALNPKNSWASPTPILDGDRVYVHFGAEGTARAGQIPKTFVR